MGCKCGCNKCKTEPLILNESMAHQNILSEVLKCHIDNKIPLSKPILKPGSEEYFDLFAEARNFYSRGIIDVNGEDLKILTETNLGYFVTINDKKHPLDFHILGEGLKTKLKNLTFDKVKETFTDDYKHPKSPEKDPSDEYYSYSDSISFPNPDDSLTVVEHENMFNYWKEGTLRKFGNVIIELNPEEDVWFNKVKIIDDKFLKDKESFNKGKQAWIDNEISQGRTSGLD
jgi:hypothetical protein